MSGGFRRGMNRDSAVDSAKREKLSCDSCFLSEFDKVMTGRFLNEQMIS